jgi:hypothetical protein
MDSNPFLAPPSKPEAVRHLAQARHDYALYQELLGRAEYLDWAVTALFYTALHLAEACLAEQFQSGGPKSHAQRDAAIYRRLRPIYPEYDHLHTRSNWARYHPQKPKPTAELLRQYETEWFVPIADHLSRLGITIAP